MIILGKASIKSNPRILIVNPHPDDGEAWCIQLCLQGINAGWDVHQLLGTCDEYGTPQKKFKGAPIRRIRKAEMHEAQRRYGCDSQGNPYLTLHWMEYIDGFVPFTANAVQRLQKFILKLQPDIIIGPDPFVYSDGHVDHIALGKVYFFALKSLPLVERPKWMLFYQTLMPDIFIRSQNPRHVKFIRAAHRSQWGGWALRFVNGFSWFYQLSYKLPYLFRFPVEGYSRVRFEGHAHKPHGLAWVIFKIFRDRPLGCEEGRFIPGPNELGLVLNPQEDII